MTSPVRVDARELMETDPHGEGLWAMEWQGAPFTGVAFELHANGQLASEIPFVDGDAHGQCQRWDANGVLLRVYEMDHGVGTGEDRAWWPDGKPRWHRIRGTHPEYREQVWNERGILISERDDAARITRRWYEGGTLCHERIGDRAQSFASDGALLLTTLRRADGRDDFHFEDDAMVQRIDEELVHPDRWHLALGFVRDLAQRDRMRGITLLRGVLRGENRLAKIDVMPLVTEHPLHELAPELEALASDETIPAFAPTSHGGRRGSTLSVGRAARDALARMGR
jgi:hypothetical protein